MRGEVYDDDEEDDQEDDDVDTCDECGAEVPARTLRLNADGDEVCANCRSWDIWDHE